MSPQVRDWEARAPLAEALKIVPSHALGDPLIRRAAYLRARLDQAGITPALDIAAVGVELARREAFGVRS